MKVQELLNKDNWIKGSNAKDSNNSSVHPLSPDASRWCLWGAIIKCYPEQFIQVATKIQEKRNIILSCWNDEPERTWEGIKVLIKEFDL